VKPFGDILHQVDEKISRGIQIFEKMAGSSGNAKQSIRFTGYHAFYKSVAVSIF
jgi:hypothetical protein